MAAVFDGGVVVVSRMPGLLESAYDSRIASNPDAALDRKDAGQVAVMDRSELAMIDRWPQAFSHLRKDSRYYEIIEDTICPEFRYRYFAIRNRTGHVCAIQPFFVLDQDLLAGVGPRVKAFADAIRRFWPRFLTMRTLMVGCAAGEGHLYGQEASDRSRQAQILAANISSLARQEKASLIVLKEFPSEYRDALSCFLLTAFR